MVVLQDGPGEFEGPAHRQRRVRLPAAIPGVRLDAGATRPTAYTTDYEWYGPVIKGSLLTLVGLGVAGGLVMMRRRYRKTAWRTCAPRSW
ncbi:hypothetical protein ACWD01_15055 [Streptomyces sp. NPDC002835]